MNNTQELQELFAIPINSKQVAIFDGKIPLYTSSYLIKQYKHTLSSEKYTASSYNLLNNLIDSRKLIPVYMSSNILSYSFKKIFGHNTPISSALAFYDPESDKIYILIDMNTTFGFASDEWLSKLTIHEMMHMSCAHGKNKFKDLFMNEYRYFYNAFFHLLSDIPINNSTTKSISKYVDKYINIFHKIEVHNGDLSDGIFKSGSQIVFDILDFFGVEKDIIKEVRDGYKIILAMYIKYGVPGIISAIKKPACKYILIKLKETYPEITGQRPSTLAIQELIFPSEIIAVFSEIGQASHKIPSAIKMIKK